MIAVVAVAAVVPGAAANTTFVVVAAAAAVGAEDMTAAAAVAAAAAVVAEAAVNMTVVVAVVVAAAAVGVHTPAVAFDSHAFAAVAAADLRTYSTFAAGVHTFAAAGEHSPAVVPGPSVVQLGRDQAWFHSTQPAGTGLRMTAAAVQLVSRAFSGYSWWHGVCSGMQRRRRGAGAQRVPRWRVRDNTERPGPLERLPGCSRPGTGAVGACLSQWLG